MQLSGAEKAVVMLLSLDESVAAPIIAELEPDELRLLREVAAKMKSVPTEALEGLYAEFIEEAQRAVAVPRGGVRYLTNIATRALRPARAHEIFVEPPRTSMQKLASADPGQLAALLEGEHPQLAAAIVSQLDPAHAAKTLEFLPEAVRAAVLTRLVTMTEVPSDVLEEAAMALGAELPEKQTGAVPIVVNGLQRSAAVVRKLGRKQGEALLGLLEAEHAGIAQDIRRSLYTFEDLLVVDAKGMRTLLESVPVERLTLALKTASETLANHVFSSMSKRAAERIREDMEALGASRLSDVEAAQREIVEAAVRLDSEGQISLEKPENG
jgi:flagellar motor switch protein FliG